MAVLLMSNVSRHRPGDTRDWFYREWHGKHVRLMRAAPGVMRRVRRYVQNPALHDPSMPCPVLPLGPEGWDALSQLTFDDPSALIECFEDPDYVATVRSHQIGDPSAMIAMMTNCPDAVREADDPARVKLVQFYRLRAGAEPASLFQALDDASPSLRSPGSGIVRSARSLPAVAISPETFAGSRWETVSFNQYAGFDEIWFENREALKDWLGNKDVADPLRDIARSFLDDASFTFLCREIVQIGRVDRL